MATAYETDVGLSATNLIFSLLAVQVVAAPFALLFGRLAGKFGAKRMIGTAIFIYIIVCLYAMFLETVVDFWILTMLVASALGGIQTLSRSYYAQMIPKEKANRFFGFYNIFGRFSAITGPLMMGAVTQVTGNSAYGILSLAVLFIMGWIVLFFVPKQTDAVSAKG